MGCNVTRPSLRLNRTSNILEKKYFFVSDILALGSSGFLCLYFEVESEMVW